MKKTVLLIALALTIAFSVNGQWKKETFVDEFGDETKEVYEYMISDGSFSNTATTDSKLKGKLINNKTLKTLKIDLYEYGSKCATHFESSFEDVKIKDPNGKVHIIEDIGFNGDGFIFFIDETYSKIMKILAIKGKHKLIVYKGRSSYLLNINILK